MKRSRSGPEAGLQNGAIQLLRLHGAFCWRNNSGALTGANGRPVWFGLKGSSDVLAVLAPCGRMLACELKDRGKRPTPAQEAFLREVASRGGVAVWVDSLDRLAFVLGILAREPRAVFTIDGTHVPGLEAS